MCDLIWIFLIQVLLFFQLSDVPHAKAVYITLKKCFTTFNNENSNISILLFKKILISKLDKKRANDTGLWINVICRKEKNVLGKHD